jgi:hypothetical protein
MISKAWVRVIQYFGVDCNPENPIHYADAYLTIAIDRL